MIALMGRFAVSAELQLSVSGERGGKTPASVDRHGEIHLPKRFFQPSESGSFFYL